MEDHLKESQEIPLSFADLVSPLVLDFTTKYLMLTNATTFFGVKTHKIGQKISSVCFIESQLSVTEVKLFSPVRSLLKELARRLLALSCLYLQASDQWEARETWALDQ